MNENTLEHIVNWWNESHRGGGPFGNIQLKGEKGRPELMAGRCEWGWNDQIVLIW